MSPEQEPFFGPDFHPEVSPSGRLAREPLLGAQGIFLNRVAFNAPISPHSHDFVELAFVAPDSGQGWHATGSERKEIGPGDLFLINFDVPHAYSPLPGETLVVRNCIFVPGFLDARLLDSRDFLDLSRHFLLQSFEGESLPPDWRVSFLPEEAGRIEALYRQMQDEYDRREEGYVEALRAWVLLLLVQVLRRLRAVRGAEVRRQARDPVLDRIVAFMESHYADDLRLRDLSMMAFLSPAHFCRQFRDYTGETCREFLIRTRVDMAAARLRETRDPVEAIAAEVGYRDLKHFQEVFRRYQGCTPGTYRRRWQVGKGPNPDRS